MTALEQSGTAAARSATQIAPVPDDETRRERRNRILSEKGIRYETTRKAWFTLSHLLLPAGSTVVEAGCGDGTMAFTMAALNPDLHFVALDKNYRLINQASAKYELPNLEYKVGDVTSTIFPENSIDAIINTNLLHVIYSGARYNEQIVEETLRIQFKMLKENGIMFIQDYAHPPPEEFVFIEMPDIPSKGESVSELSEADLLVWYAEHARPRQDPLCGGFFLEELPAPDAGKRLFRLPYKWAYEFILRKDDRAQWESELPMEYMFYTPREFRRTLRTLGARVLYSGPHWDEDYVREHFQGKFRLFDDNQEPLGDPPTSFIVVARKMAERKSLNIEERRPSADKKSSLILTGVRNKKTGEVVDIVKREQDISEIIPYRITPEGELKIYLHDGVARSIVNAVPRGGYNFDGRRWSGHMIEPIAVAADAVMHSESFDKAQTTDFAKSYLGLTPENNARMNKGPDYYPSPDYIDERIFTFYINIIESKKEITPKPPIDHAGRFHAKGKIREFDAQDVLNAISVGVIPNARLELQVLSLFEHLNIRAENWDVKEFQLQRSKVSNKIKAKDLLLDMNSQQEVYEEVKPPKGHLRAIHSIFVEEGLIEGSNAGLSAQDVDFVVQNSKTINTAVVLPISKDMKNDIHAGFLLEQLPVPQRYEGKATTIAAPSFELPAHITNMKMAKHFIAEKFGLTPDMVFKLGESYFTHAGLTPQRIHPFAVANPRSGGTTTLKFLPFYQLKLLRKLLDRDSHFMIAIARAFKLFHDEIRMDLQHRASAIVQERFNNVKPQWSLPLYYDSAPIGKRVIKLGGDTPDMQELLQPANTQDVPDAKPIAETLYKPAPDMQLKSEFEDFISTLEEIKKGKQAKPSPGKW